jgi:PTS system mannose-specific IIC component
MITLPLLLVLLLWGTIVGLDVVTFPQSMVSRPLVAGTVTGMLIALVVPDSRLNPVFTGMLVGSVLELYALDVLPFGAARYPDFGPATVSAVYAALGWKPEAGLGGATAVGLVTAVLGGWTMQMVRRANAAAIQRKAAALAAGDTRAIRSLQLGGIRRDIARSAGVTACGLLLGIIIWPLLPPGSEKLSLGVGGGGRRWCRRGVERRDPGGRTHPAPRLGDGRTGRRNPHRGVAMNGRWRAFLRLFAVQGAWNYERMLGVGMGYAAEPLLEDLGNADPGRHAEAVVPLRRVLQLPPVPGGPGAGSHGARRVRPGPRPPDHPAAHRAVQPPRCAGGSVVLDRALACAPLGCPYRSVFSGPESGSPWFFSCSITSHGSRPASGRCGPAWPAGADVGHKIADSWLPKAARRVGPVAGFLIGLAVPLVGDWALQWVTGYQFALAVGIALLGMFLSLRFRHSITSVRFALGMIALTVAWRWIA